MLSSINGKVRAKKLLFHWELNDKKGDEREREREIDIVTFLLSYFTGDGITGVVVVLLLLRWDNWC